MKQIPLVLNHPIVITEYKDKSGNVSIHVYGELIAGSSPVVVGVMIGKHRNGLSVDKVQTVHPNRNVISGVTKENTLYLNEKKRNRFLVPSPRSAVASVGGNQVRFHPHNITFW